MPAATTAASLRVLLVDDSPRVRHNLRGAVEQAGLTVVAEAADGTQALTQAAARQPDVVLMDLQMPGMDGVQATRELLAGHAATIVLLLAGDGDESLVVEALLAGARGYLRKGAGATELADTISGAVAGELRIGGQATGPLLAELVETLGRERQARQATEQARRASEDLRRRQQQVSTVAAHELRTPIAALLGSLATLERLLSADRLEPQELALLAACGRQARRLARLVEDFRVVATHASGGVSVTPTRVEVAQLLEGVVADLEHMGAKRVRVVAAPGLWARADPDRLAQVLINLVRNALQYSPPGSPVEVVAAAGPGVVQLVVSDRGPGIPPDRLPELFDRFGEHSAGKVAGLGVGLWIVRELLAAMGGNVWVEHNASGGSSFCVAIPAVSQH